MIYNTPLAEGLTEIVEEKLAPGGAATGVLVNESSPRRTFLTPPRFQSCWLRSRSAFVMTLTEDSAIAAAAMTGERSQPKNG
jgi:hypothetical protein